MEGRPHSDSAAGSVHRFRDLDALSRAVADEVIEILRTAVQARGRGSLALSGGKTPERSFRVLADRGPRALPWHRIDLFWSDERAVPPSHPASNYRMAREALIDPLGLPGDRVHRVAGELGDPAAAAREYEAELVRALGAPPVIDLVLLGLGADGHTASIFPGTVSPAEAASWAMSSVAPGSAGGAGARITLTPRTLNAARHVRFVVAGAEKAGAVAAAIEGPRDPLWRPAHRIVLVDGEVGWRLDDAAAAGLEARS
jgi:6-phosphogluconolactonase